MMCYFQLLIDFGVVKCKIDMFYLNSFVILGFKYEIYSLVSGIK